MLTGALFNVWDGSYDYYNMESRVKFGLAPCAEFFENEIEIIGGSNDKDSGFIKNN